MKTLFTLTLLLFLSLITSAQPCKIVTSNVMDCDPQLELRFYQVIYGIETLIEKVPLNIRPGSWDIPTIDTSYPISPIICDNCDTIVYKRRIFRNDTDITNKVFCCYHCLLGDSGTNKIWGAADSCHGCCGKVEIVCIPGSNELRVNINIPPDCSNSLLIIRRKEEY